MARRRYGKNDPLWFAIMAVGGLFLLWHEHRDWKLMLSLLGLGLLIPSPLFIWWLVTGRHRMLNPSKVEFEEDAVVGDGLRHPLSSIRALNLLDASSDGIHVVALQLSLHDKRVVTFADSRHDLGELLGRWVAALPRANGRWRFKTLDREIEAAVDDLGLARTLAYTSPVLGGREPELVRIPWAELDSVSGDKHEIRFTGRSGEIRVPFNGVDSLRLLAAVEGRRHGLAAAYLQAAWSDY